MSCTTQFRVIRKDAAPKGRLDGASRSTEPHPVACVPYLNTPLRLSKILGEHIALTVSGPGVGVKSIS